MTKRLTIALIAVALFVLMAVMPVSAALPKFANGTIINQGATIFIGEEGLNVTHALNSAYYGATCGGTMTCTSGMPYRSLHPNRLVGIGSRHLHTAPSRTSTWREQQVRMT